MVSQKEEDGDESSKKKKKPEEGFGSTPSGVTNGRTSRCSPGMATGPRGGGFPRGEAKTKQITPGPPKPKKKKTRKRGSLKVFPKTMGWGGMQTRHGRRTLRHQNKSPHKKWGTARDSYNRKEKKQWHQLYL